MSDDGNSKLTDEDSTLSDGIVDTESYRELLNDKETMNLLKKEIQDIVNIRLQELGISPEWTGIPWKTYEKSMKILQHQTNLLKKTIPNFDNTKKKLDRDVRRQVEPREKIEKKEKQVRRNKEKISTKKTVKEREHAKPAQNVVKIVCRAKPKPREYSEQLVLPPKRNSVTISHPILFETQDSSSDSEQYSPRKLEFRSKSSGIVGKVGTSREMYHFDTENSDSGDFGTLEEDRRRVRHEKAGISVEDTESDDFCPAGSENELQRPKTEDSGVVKDMYYESTQKASKSSENQRNKPNKNRSMLVKKHTETTDFSKKKHAPKNLEITGLDGNHSKKIIRFDRNVEENTKSNSAKSLKSIFNATFTENVSTISLQTQEKSEVSSDQEKNVFNAKYREDLLKNSSNLDSFKSSSSEDNIVELFDKIEEVDSTKKRSGFQGNQITRVLPKIDKKAGGDKVGNRLKKVLFDVDND